MAGGRIIGHSAARLKAIGSRGPGTVPIFVSAKMGLSPFHGGSALPTQVPDCWPAWGGFSEDWSRNNIDYPK